jgi:hypothetical protein
VLFERIDLRGPEMSERVEPGVEFLEGLGSQAIQTALRLNTRFHEPALAQHPKVLGDGRLRQAECAFKLANRAFGRQQKAQDGPAMGLCNNGK